MNQFFKRIVGYMADQYVTVLISMAVVACITYLVLIYDLQSHEGGAASIRLSAEQSQLVQQIELAIGRIAETQSPKKQTRIRGEVVSLLTKLKDSHISLSRGDRFVHDGSRLIHVAGELSSELGRVYHDAPYFLDDKIQNFIATVKKLLSIEQTEFNRRNPEIRRFLMEDRSELLAGFERALSLQQSENEYKVVKTVNRQHLMFAITLCSLIIIGVAILRPLVFKIRESMDHLQEEKDFTENILDTSQALIIGVDAARHIILFNEYAQEITGWQNEEIGGRDFFEPFFPDGDKEKMEALFDEMIRGEKAEGEIETRMTIRSGEVLQVTWHNTVIRDKNSGKPVLFLATGIDVTQRKEAEVRLQDTLSELEKISRRLQNEIELAANLQKAILPSPVIDLPGIQGQAKLLTSTEVGGDYYDYFPIAGHKSVLLVGDVSGHGVAAGTMVSAAKAGIYPLIHEGVSRPSEILRTLNETILATAHQSLLMTMACISLDARSGTLHFANAGHVLPYIRRKHDRKWSMIESSGMPLGTSIDSDYAVAEVELELNIGDRLFLYTDGLVEEESPVGEPFGYERLEKVLDQYGDTEPEVLHEQLMAELHRHCGGRALTDDVTVVIVNHTDRVFEAASAGFETSDIIRVSEDFYRQGEHPIPRIPRQYVVFFAEHSFADLLPRFKRDGVCRIIPKNNPFYQKIGMERLLNQHHEGVDSDIYSLIPHSRFHRQFELTHSDDKLFVMEEIQSWLSEHNLSGSEYLDSLIVIMDELLENSLYAAPRDGQDNTFYNKGQSRELASNEDIRIDILLDGDVLGLMVTDNWGTLGPATFLRSLERAMHQGIVAGVGGGGLYLMWCLSDYLQIRVHPHKRTQVTLLWDLGKPFEMSTATGFQFLYHSEQEEVLS
ncbi:MAG: SpoIIE family protein phosphatase [Methylococcaceae bacterium]|nr:SpoIIE family protein phosphatase [Methylococcaceae bacterium]